MTKIKICGLRREEDISYVNECNPDYIGFVFANTKRKVTKEEALHLRGLLNEGIIPVGVFVNEDVEVVADLVNSGCFDVPQLHGDEDNAYIAKLRSLIGDDKKIIKAIRVKSKEDIENSNLVDADYLLFDAFSLKEYGGTGTSFDWNLISDIRKPFFLAGGIDMDNVDAAIDGVKPYAVDLSSSVETDGFKDHDKVVAIVNKVKERK